MIPLDAIHAIAAAHPYAFWMASAIGSHISSTRHSSTVKLCWTCLYVSGSFPLCLCKKPSKIVAFSCVHSSSWQLACLCGSIKSKLCDVTYSLTYFRNWWGWIHDGPLHTLQENLLTASILKICNTVCAVLLIIANTKDGFIILPRAYGYTEF